MVILNEFLPNPIGKDADGEFIELFNGGPNPIDLNGWKLKDSSGKTFVFSAKGGFVAGGKNQKIGPEEYLILDYKTTKISLNNNGETIFLYDDRGNLADRAEYDGNAEAGKALIRKDGPREDRISPGMVEFVFTDSPTPGKSNIFRLTEPKNSPPILGKNGGLEGSLGEAAVPFYSAAGTFWVRNLAAGLGLALILAFTFVIIYKKLNEN